MKRIIIYGASSGIGMSLARLYAAQGEKIAVAARRIENLEQLQQEYPGNIIPFKMDVSKGNEVSNPNSPRTGFHKMVETLGGADLVIYCSGMGKQNASLDMEIEYRTIDVNVTGFTTIAAATVEYGSKAGHHVQFATISSIASFRGIGVSASYSGTKMYQVRYMQSLRQLATIKGLDMSFTTIRPGFIDTDFIKGQRYPMTLPLEYAAKKIKKAIDNRKASAIIDWKWSAVVALWKMIPNWLWYRLKVSN